MLKEVRDPKVLTAHKVYKEQQVHKVTLVLRETSDHKVAQALRGLKVYKEQQVHKVTLVHKEQMAHKEM